jgi:hypothetical protein
MRTQGLHPRNNGVIDRYRQSFRRPGCSRCGGRRQPSENGTPRLRVNAPILTPFLVVSYPSYLPQVGYIEDAVFPTHGDLERTTNVINFANR